MAVLQMLRNDLDQAEEYGLAALEIAGEVDDPHGIVEGRMVLAYCAKANRRVAQALELAAAASRIAFEYGYVPLIQEQTWLQGYLYLQRRECQA